MAIKSSAFSKDVVAKLRSTEVGKDWPVVYILENSKEAYVGETVSAAGRLRQHLDNPERQKLLRAHVITDAEYNKSATLDIESWLIQYMVADGKFELQNGNAGLMNHSYYDREKYRAKFELTWEELQAKGLAGKDLLELRNSDIFKYSPYKSLTDEQVAVVERIHESLVGGEKRTHIVHGEPGTGKSVLATYLMKYLLGHKDSSGLRAALVVPQAGLRSTLKKVFSKVKGLRASMVIGPAEVVSKHYDVLIVDEAHRLRRRVNLSSYGPFDKANEYYGLGKEGTQLDWILHASSSQVLLYDLNQSVVPGDIRPESLENLNPVEYRLNSQLRVTAGDDYIHFIESLFSQNSTSIPNFPRYELKYFTGMKDMIDKIKLRDKEHGLARVVAGYAWTWETKKGGDFDIELDGLRLKWNSTNIDWVNSTNAINEVGCIHTVQGYDLNYVGVIIGPEVRYEPTLGKILIDKKQYKDFNGKRSVQSDEELEKYIINIYKTLLTRGIRGTYIHAADKALEEYLIGRIGVT